MSFNLFERIMKKIITSLCFLFIVGMTVMSCYDDQGNYTYHEIEDPKVLGLVDEIVVAYVGDSLIIKPRVEHSLVGTEELSFDWEISNHVDLRGEFFKGRTLRMLFNLKPEKYPAKLTITNHSNGMKYFYKFMIEGRTEFTSGTVVLSSDQGVGRLSFIKGGNDLRANLYEGLHGENLPMDPKQIIIVDHAWLKAYHVLTGEENKPGVILDAATMLRVKNLEDNFFERPNVIHAESLIAMPVGVSAGVINGKLYGGQWQTCPCSPIFGFYGGAAVGDYELSPWFNFYGSHYLGYDKKTRRLVQFDINMNYSAANYQVIPMSAEVFDPKNLDVDLLYLKNINPETSYAFGKTEGGTVYEYKFQDVPGAFFVKGFREFPGASLLREDTHWQASSFEIFYFTSDDEIYRYNPVNQELRVLDADFAGKKVTMIKLIDNDLLIAGVEGSLHYLDVSTGRNGEVYKVINDIPGNPVDVVVRK
jgi:hypothetical protein